jgi:hypothetical protein
LSSSSLSINVADTKTLMLVGKLEFPGIMLANEVAELEALA